TYGEEDADLAAVLLEALRRQRHRLGVAESCTGGMIGERITNVPGASDTFIGGVVAYADVIKTAALKVPLETLEAYGAVSEETVRAMAEGAQRLFSADCTIAVTGIAGPGGGTLEKPVGTVWLAARVHTTTRALKRVLPGDRDDVRRRANCRHACARCASEPAADGSCLAPRSAGSGHCATWKPSRATPSSAPWSSRPGSGWRSARPLGKWWSAGCSRISGPRCRCRPGSIPTR